MSGLKKEIMQLISEIFDDYETDTLASPVFNGDLVECIQSVVDDLIDDGQIIYDSDKETYEIKKGGT